MAGHRLFFCLFDKAHAMTRCHSTQVSFVVCRRTRNRSVIDDNELLLLLLLLLLMMIKIMMIMMRIMMLTVNTLSRIATPSNSA